MKFKAEIRTKRSLVWHFVVKSFDVWHFAVGQFAVWVIAVSVLCMSACQRRPEAVAEQDAAEDAFVIAIPSAGSIAAGENQCTEKLGEILQAELGVNVRFMFLDMKRYDQEMKKLLAGNSRVDIMVTLSNMYTECWLRKDLLPLNTLLDTWGGQIIEGVGRDMIDMCAIDGEVYGIPNVRDYAVTTDCYYLNLDILERNGVRISDIDSLEKLEQVFETVHKNEPEIIILSTYLQSLCVNDYYLSAISAYPVGVLAENGQGDAYVDYFTSEMYKTRLERINKWYELGYIQMDIKSDEVVRSTGETLAMIRSGKPGADLEISGLAGARYGEVALGNAVVSQDSYTSITYTITKNTPSPEKSMEILNYMFQSREINQLLSECIPEWMVPDLFLTDVPEGYPADLWEQTKAFNSQAIKAGDVGFVFDPSTVMQEYTEVVEIYNCYRPILENGLLDTQQVLNRMNEEMEAAGIQKIIDEKNSQFTRWKAGL